MRYRKLQFFCLVGIVLSSVSFSFAQPKKWKKEVRKFQRELNQHYRDKDDSPLKEEDRAHFKKHDFFPVGAEYCVKSKFVRTPDEAQFEMPTVSGKTKPFVKYGEFHFTMQGKKHKLNVYQNLKYVDHPEYGQYLFLPFKDASSGAESYGGGRYIDIKIPEAKTVYVDFNQCYNPYCAYSTGWNCPIPPVENVLDVKVLAGVKKWGKGH
ncbi:MAG: DUF1684 domain-containing protein [Bacteroidota bacterium]